MIEQLLDYFSESEINYETINKLRTLVFDLSIRGKLTAQDPEDETANVLLKQIAEVKAGLVNEKKIKIPKLRPIETEEMPFEPPAGWSFERLGNFADTSWGDTSLTKSSFINTGYTAYSAAGPDGKIGHFDFDKPGVVISAIGARCGRTFLASGKWTAIKNTMTVIPFLEHEITASYLNIWASGSMSFPRRGGAQPFLSLGDVRHSIVPIPPLAEKYRIVVKVNQIMKLLADLEESSNTLHMLQSELIDSLIIESLEAI